MSTRLGGWWRLWIVGCVVYGVVVAAVTVNLMPGVEDVRHEDAFIKLHSDEVIRILRDAAAKAKAPVDANAPFWARDPIVLKMPNGFELQVPGTTTPAEADVIVQDYARILEKKLTVWRLKIAGLAVAAWVIPCLIALALGMAVRWVRQGFSKP